MKRRFDFQKKSKIINKTAQFTVLLCMFFIVLGASVVWAGPPSVTDDPEPVEYKHGEFYVASVTGHNSDGTLGTLPHFELNYGPLPDVQLHLIAPQAPR